MTKSKSSWNEWSNFWTFFKVFTHVEENSNSKALKLMQIRTNYVKLWKENVKTWFISE